MPFYIQYT